MSDIKVSVVMPVYNQERYLRDCLLSVCGQTLKDIEILVVNDGSTDSSLAIAREIAETDPRILVIDKENGGYGSAVNRGLDLARGEYVGIVETDDFVAPDLYERLYALSEEGTVDVVKGNFYDYYDDPAGGRLYRNEERRNVPTGKVTTVRSDPQILWGHPSVWSGIYRRAMLEKHGIRFLEAKGGGWVDNPFFFDTLFHAESYVWTDEPLYYYRKTNADSSSNRIGDPTLPFVRMEDNLDVAERNGFRDLETLKLLYARALMYMVGAQKECDYDNNREVIDRAAKALMCRCRGRVFDEEFNLPDRYLYHTNASPVKTLLQGCPKVLIYNWVPFDNPAGIGGGVTVYCRNLIRTILEESPTTQVYFLSCGYAYDATRTEVYYRATPNLFGERVHSYEIVNSPVPADQWLLYRNPTVALGSERLKGVFAAFLDRVGPFDVLHFNNVEGLSLDVLDLKADRPNTKFLYTIHNYNAMCLTGFYYQRHTHRICDASHTAEDCRLCSAVNMGSNVAKILYQRALLGSDPERCLPEPLWKERVGLSALDRDVSAEAQLSYATLATEKLNENCDAILAVSERVREIALKNGFAEEKISVSYIGTAVADSAVGHSVARAKEGLRIVFLGSDLHYEEKGYPFLLRALSRLEKEYAQRIDVVLTAKNEDTSPIYDALGDYRSVTVRKGYAHRELGAILADCDLSIVPVLWEDNLPQIAIESVAYGVPVLASDAGGASELCDDERFRFRHGDEEDFLRKLKAFVLDPPSVRSYWAAHRGLVTMREHWRDLNARCYGVSDVKITLAKEDVAPLLAENDFLRRHFDGREEDRIVIGNRTFDPEEARAALQTYVENEALLRVTKSLGLSADSLYFKLIAALNRRFPKGSRRREFIKKLYRRKEE